MTPIETARLVLRNFRPEDALALFEYLHAPTASCFLSLKLDDMAAAQGEAARRAVSDEYVAVCLKDTDRLIGEVFAHRDDDADDEPGRPSRADTFSVGWNFNPAFGGNGYALEAARALCADLFGQQGARRVYAYVEDYNTPSRRLCDKLGMREEGTFVEFVTFRNDDAGNPIYETTMQYAILQREWAISQGA